jgi:hypothetical protein
MAMPVMLAVGQVSEVIEPERTGWLYKPGDAFELARPHRRLAPEREHRRAVGVAARERVMQEYTWRHNAACGCYCRSVIAGGGRPATASERTWRRRPFLTEMGPRS